MKNVFRIANCSKITTPIVFNKVEKCYKQIQVTFCILKEGTELTGYLNDNEIIKEHSDEIDCLQMNSVGIMNLTLITRMNKYLHYIDMRPHLNFKYQLNQTLTSKLIILHEKGYYFFKFLKK